MECHREQEDTAFPDDGCTSWRHGIAVAATAQSMMDPWESQRWDQSCVAVALHPRRSTAEEVEASSSWKRAGPPRLRWEDTILEEACYAAA